MRELKSIIIHCSATKPSQNITVDTIRKWHVEDNNWSDIGYHYVIERSGEVMNGRPVQRAGAHAKGYNSDSIGVCMVGGIDENGRPDSNFTRQQWSGLDLLVQSLAQKYGIREVFGHREVSDKACPSFDARSWWDA